MLQVFVGWASEVGRARGVWGRREGSNTSWRRRAITWRAGGMERRVEASTRTTTTGHGRGEGRRERRGKGERGRQGGAENRRWSVGGQPTDSSLSPSLIRPRDSLAEDTNKTSARSLDSLSQKSTLMHYIPLHSMRSSDPFYILPRLDAPASVFIVVPPAGPSPAASSWPPSLPASLRAPPWPPLAGAAAGRGPSAAAAAAAWPSAGRTEEQQTGRRCSRPIQGSERDRSREREDISPGT